MLRIISIFLLVLPSLCCGQYTLNGSALSNGNTCFSVTPNSSWQLGSIWNNTPIDLSINFDIQFSMNLGNQDGNGADGIVFVLQQQGVNALGTAGSGLGFQGLSPSIGIEFDTFQNNIPNDPLNNANDPVSDHMAIFKNGLVNHSSPNQLAGPVNISATNINIEDGLNHNVRIVWNATTFLLQIFIDCNLRLSLNQNLTTSTFNGNPLVFWGFTGSTGGLFNNQSVCLPTTIQGEIILPPVCPGNSASLSAPSNAYTNIAWEPANLVATANATNTTAIISENTEFFLTFDDVCGNSYAYTYLASVTPGLQITLPSDTSLCAGEEIQIEAQINGSYSNFTWYGTPGASLYPNNTLSPIVSGSGNYQIFVESTNGCTYSETFSITNLPTPNVVWPSTTTFCPDSTFILTPEINAEFWTWENGGQSSSFELINSDTVFITMQSGSCISNDSIFIEQLQIPTVDLGADQTYCLGESVTLNTPIPGIWNNNVLSNSYTINATNTITFSSNIQGCPIQDTLFVSFQTPPQVNLGNDTILCSGTSLLLTTEVSGLWNNSITSNQFNVTASGTFSFLFDDGICQVSDEIEIGYIPYLQEILPDTIVRCLGEQFVLNGAQNTATNYSWSNGVNEPQQTFTQSGVYSLFTSNTCESISESVIVDFSSCEHTLWIPNAFSPNGDGDNDVWAPQFSEMISLDIRIYDRWGTLVFRGDKSNFFWNGNVRNGNHIAQDGAYTYAIRYATNFDVVEEIRGHLILFR
ncbi:MAG: T9SS type B sorting domain-containing protein [Bacteroidetes bacterium]|nr:T9SS type B sorting domain-containing protein [Bacteroidota bacterium]